MPGINQVIRADRELSRDYNRRRRALERAFEFMVRGAMRRCAEAIGVDKTSVWAVLRGKRVSLSTLVKIENWMREKEGVVEGDPSTEATDERSAI